MGLQPVVETLGVTGALEKQGSCKTFGGSRCDQGGLPILLT